MAEEAQRLPAVERMQIRETLLLQFAILAEHQTQIGQVHDGHDAKHKVNRQHVRMPPLVSVFACVFARGGRDTGAEHVGQFEAQLVLGEREESERQ